MTKLMEWLAGATLIFAVWAALVTNKIENDFTRHYFSLVLYFPVIFVIMFALYSGIVVLYRVLTFNDCEVAALDLQDEIEEAKEDLAKLGFLFK